MAAHLYWYISVCFIATTILLSSEGSLLGGYTGWKQPDADIQELAYEVKSEAVSMCGCGTFRKFEVLKYKSQVVNGVNYIMKVSIGKGRKIRIKLYKPFVGEPQLQTSELI